MTNPAIQNDFSYYRRTISRNRLNNQQVRPYRSNSSLLLSNNTNVLCKINISFDIQVTLIRARNGFIIMLLLHLPHDMIIG